MTRPLTPKTLIYDLPAASDPQVSPDGTRIVYTLTTVDAASKQPRSHLWLCAIDGGQPCQLTQTGTRNTGARWSPDGTRIVFTSDRVATSGIFVMPADAPGEAREITRHAQGIGELAWAPDGQRIAYTTRYDPENPDEHAQPPDRAPKVHMTRRLDYKQDGRGYLGDARSHVFVVDVASGTRRRLTTTPRDHNFPQWSPDGCRLAVQVSHSSGMYSQLALVDVDAGEITWVGPEDGVVGVWAWSPRGDRIIYADDPAQAFQFDFFVYDGERGAARRLTDDLPSLPAAGYPLLLPPSQPAWLDERHVLFHAIRAGQSGLEIIDSETGATTLVQRWQSLNVGLSTDRTTRYVAQAHASLHAHGEIGVYDWAEATMRTITTHNTLLLAERPPARWERFDVQRGEFTIEAWLLTPPDFDPHRRYPVILDVHGGPHMHYGYGFRPLQQCLATNGFLVVFCNPRGSSSYGRHFTQQVLRDWGGEDFQDLLAVLDAVLERSYADLERTGISGYSYGGYMTAWAISQTNRFKAAVCGAPAFDLVSMYGTSDIGSVFGAQEAGGPPHAVRDWYVAHSPSTYAHRTRTPTLIVHGEDDERCPIGQGEQMFVALQQAGCEVEFVRYPGASHLFIYSGWPAHRADYLARTLAWFKDHLGEPVALD